MKGSHKGFGGLSELWIKGQSSLYIYIYIADIEGQSFYLKDKISLLLLYLKVSVYLYYILFFLLEYVIKWLNLPYFNS